MNTFTVNNLPRTLPVYGTRSNTDLSKVSFSLLLLSSQFLLFYPTNRTPYNQADSESSENSFTAIGGNLVGAPALVGNVLVWKPSPMATYASWVVFQILLEAGLPKNVIQFLPCPNGDATVQLVDKVISHRMFAGLHFTGSTHVFKHLWKEIAGKMDNYLSYPRLVGETGGKNFQLVHESADIRASVVGAIRGAFEYQGMFSYSTFFLSQPRLNFLMSYVMFRSKMFCSFSTLRSQETLGG